MKASDIQRIRAAGLITGDQEQAIVAHFHLDREGNLLVRILGIIGAVLASAGVILLIASHWEEVPPGVKIAAGALLLVAAHVWGWWMGRDGRHPAISDALHLTGSLAFLANIALVGQIYNLSSRPPNAILLWLVGIAPMPWILKSKAQHILTLVVFGIWLGLEMNQEDSLLYFGGDLRQCLFYSMVGVLFSAIGVWISGCRRPEFGPSTEKFGLLMLHIASYPLTIRFFYDSHPVSSGAWVICGSVSLATLALLGANVRHESLLPDRQWRWTWTGVLAGALGLAWMGLLWKTERPDYGSDWAVRPGPHWIALPLLFIVALLQAQVGILRHSRWLINVAVLFMGVHIVTAYFQLFGTMRTTGLMFVVSGGFLLGLATYLERKRRWLLQRMAQPPSPRTPTP
jgi:uncharacterized membrane protein